LFLVKSRTMTLPLGKLPPELLARFFSPPPSDPRVILGPAIGMDCAVIDIGDQYLVAKTDPITFATAEIGWYAVHVNANDIATTGAMPQWFMATLLLPEGESPPAMIESIFGQIRRACAEVGAELVGGHTEITYGLQRPIICGTILGEVAKADLLTPRGARPDDVILLTKGLPLEGAAIIAREKADELSGRVNKEVIERAANLLYRPGLSVLPDARAALRGGRVSAMHDPTEGGLAGGLWELAEAAGLGIEVELDRVPILPEGREICLALGLDPLATIASGALLLTAAPDQAPGIQAALGEAGIDSAVIGRMVKGAGVSGLARPERDEIARLFSGEMLLKQES